jgi:hypothetical protein
LTVGCEPVQQADGFGVGLGSNGNTTRAEEALPQEVAGTSDVAKKVTESGLEMASYVAEETLLSYETVAE